MAPNDDYNEDSAEDIEEAAEQEDFEGLRGLDVQEILRIGQKDLFARLVSKVRSGRASHQESAILRNLLKDNGLTLGLPQGNREDAAPEEPVELPPEYQDIEEFEEGPGYYDPLVNPRMS